MRYSELLLIIRGQNQASQMIRRVQADLASLGRTAGTANVHQMAIQDQIVRGTQRAAGLQQSIAAQEARIAAQRGIVAQQQASQLANFARQRENVLRTQAQLERDLQAKQLAAGKVQQLITTNTTGSGALRNQIAKANLDERGMSLANQRVNAMRDEMRMQRDLYGATASRIRLEEKMRDAGMGAMIGQRSQLEALAKSSAVGSAASRAMANDWLRLDQQIQQIEVGQKNITAEQALWNDQVSKLGLQEQRILATIDEQAVKIAQAQEQLQLYEMDLAKINAQLAGISGEYERITASEQSANLQNQERLRELNEQTAALERQKIALSEQIAVNQRLASTDMQRAVALDAQAAHLARMQKLQSAGATIAGMGRTAQFTGLIATAGLGAAAVQAAHFNTELTLAATQMANTPKEIARATNELGGEILKLMQRFPAAQTDMAKSAYDIFSSIPGLTGSGQAGLQRGYQFLQLANQAAVAGNTSLDESTQALIRVYNNFSNSGESLSNTMSRMFAIVKYGNMHFSDFASILGNIGPAAMQAHQSLNDLAGVIALASRQMAPAQVGTSISRLLQVYQRPTFIEGAKELGVQVTHMVDGVEQLLPLPRIIQNWVTKYGSLQAGGVQLANLFKTVTAAGGVGTGQSGTQGTAQALRLQGILMRNYPELHRLSLQIVSDNQELQRSYAAMTQTTGVRWAIFMNMLRATTIRFGLAVIPVFENVGGKIRVLVNWFNQLSPHTRSIIGQFAAWSAIGLILGGTLAKIIGMITQISGALAILSGSKAIQKIGTDATLANTEAGLLATTLRGMAGMVIPVIFALEVRSQIEPWINKAQGWVTKTFGSGAGAAFGAATAGWPDIYRYVKKEAGVTGSYVGLGSTPATPLQMTDAEKAASAAVQSNAKLAQAIQDSTAVPLKLRFAAHKHLADTQWLDQVAAKYGLLTKAVKDNGLAWLDWEHRLVQAKVAADRSGKPSDLLAFIKLQDLIQSKVTPAQYETIMQMISGVSGNKRQLPGTGPGAISEAKWNQEFQRVRELKKIMDAHPKNYQDALAFEQAIDKLRQHSTDAQMNAVQQILSADSQTVRNQAKVKLTPEQFKSQFVAVENLYRTALRHPNDNADWQRYFTAKTKLFADATAAEKALGDKVLSDMKKNITAQQAALKQAAADEAAVAAAGVTAHKNAMDKISTMVQHLGTVFDDFQRQSESTFGTLGQGRIMQGPIGSVYSQLSQYGITPPFKLVLQDLQSQVSDFGKYQGALQRLKTLGAPAPLLSELQSVAASGYQGQQYVEAIAGASASQVKAYIKVWQTKKKDIQDATQINFQAQLQQWKSYGQGALKALLEGMRSQSSWLKKGFTKYILEDTLQASFRAWILKNLPNYVQDAVKAAEAAERRKRTAREKAAQERNPNAPAPTTYKTTAFYYQPTVHPLPGESVATLLRRHKHEMETGVRRWGFV